MRRKFTAMHFDVSKALQSTPTPVNLDDLIRFLINARPQLKFQLVQCKNIHDILMLISDNCSLTDITLLESAVLMFNIEQAYVSILQYKRTLNDLYQKIPLQFLPLSETPETLIFIVHHSCDDDTLHDINDILQNAFSDTIINVEVKKST